MIKKVVTKKNLKDAFDSDTLSYWLRKTPADRIAAVEYLRRQVDGSTARLQKIARVIQRPQS